MDQLLKNLNGPILKLRKDAHCKVFLAIKGFSPEAILPNMAIGLDGISASGAFEAKLGKTSLKKNVCTFSPAYHDNNFEEVIQYSDMIIFNSMRQYETFSLRAYNLGCSCGIRINPEYTELPMDFSPNPCQKYSRLGILKNDMPDISLFSEGQIEGIHIHTMCEQDAGVLERSVDYLIQKYDKYLKRIKWLNLGGGQMYSANDYDLERAIRILQKLYEQYDFEIILEPCEGIITNCGFLVASVVDIVHNEMDIAILDASGVCHFPDTVYRNWKHDIKGAGEPGDFAYNYRLTGPSCYAGDIWGDYSFSSPLQIGQKITFIDTAAYSMVKNNYFNGIPYPSLAIFDSVNGLQILKSYDYSTFLQCQ